MTRHDDTNPLKGAKGQCPLHQRAAFVFAIALLLAAAAPAHAQPADVKVDVSSRETYVGVPVTLTITISNTTRYFIPEFTIDGANVQKDPTPTTMSSTSIINGVKSVNNTTTYNYRIVPTRAGVLTIPALDVRLDGAVNTTEPIEVLVKEIGVEDGDAEKLILEIESDRNTYYLGEPVDATLRIWILPYRDQQYNVTVRRDDMWRLVNEDLSNWGEFEDAVTKLRNSPFAGLRQDTAPPEGGETLREVPGAPGNAGDHGNPENRRSYYFYELRATVWPKQAGELSLDDIQVMMEYPTRLGRRRGFFQDSLTITDSKLLAARIEQSPIVIKPTPDEGKPACFAGAVGQYSISVQAQPTDVAVGDPITLAIDIRDRTGASRLDVLQPPPLDATPELAEHFRIPTDPLAGEVVGNTKRFVQTIRAESDDVSRIPPIQFAYFDPVRERYVTVESDAIPLHVAAGTSLAMTDIVEAPGGPPPSPSGPTQLTAVTGGVLANYTGADALLASQRLTIGWTHVGLVFAPPFLVGIVALARRRAERIRTDVRYARRRGARRAALRRLADVAEADPDARIDKLVQAVSGYIADRCHLPPGAHTRRELVERLRERAVDDELVSDVETLLADCEHSRYAGATSKSADEAADAARQLIDRLERERFA